MNEIICRECHSPNKSGSKFCSSCGASLKPATHIICPTCYHRNALHLLYCDSCGTRLIKHPTRPIADSGSQPPPPETAPSARGFSLPARSPGETAELNPDSLPDWLKTGIEKKPGIPPAEEERLSDWLSELKTTGSIPQTGELGDFNLDWLNEPTPTPTAPAAPPPPVAEPEPDFSFSFEAEEPTDESLDWLAAFREEDDDSTRTGFTGWLTPTADEAQAAVDDEPQEQDDDWLTTAEKETFISEDSGRTGFTGWLESKRLNPSDVGLDDEDEEDDLPPLPSSAGSGFTGWLREQELLDNPVPTSGTGQAAEAEESSGFTGWLSNQGLTAADDQDDTSQWDTSAAADDMDDWMVDEGLAELPTAEDDQDTRQAMVGTGFTGWLNPETIQPFEPQQDPHPTSSAPLANELPDWLDTGELTPIEEQEEEEVGTGFTGWLNPEVVASMAPPPPTPTPTAEPEIPDWLLAGDDDEAGGTGFTDWLAGGKAEDGEESGTGDLDWMEEEEDEVMPQELMTPLSKEEAQKLLQDTPDVSESFIEEVVEGDFPDWLTDVKNNDEPVSTDVLPDWISAPLSTTDELELGLHPSRMEAARGSKPLPTAETSDDDWLSGFGVSASSPSFATGDDSWLTDLGTAETTSDDDWLGGLASSPTASPAVDQDDNWLGDLGSFGVDEDEPDESLDEAWTDLAEPTAAQDAAAWLADLSTEPPLATSDDDWMAGLQLSAMSSGDTDFLREIPKDTEDEAQASWTGLDTGTLSGLDWLTQEEETAEEDWAIAEPEPPAPAAPAPPDEFAFLSGEGATYVPLGDDDEETDGFDWLGALEDVELEPASTTMSDRQAWLQGADLEEDAVDDGASRAVDKEVEEALRAASLFTQRAEPEPTAATADIAQLVRNLQEDDLGDEEILSELESLRQSDEGDLDIPDVYHTHLEESNADITSGDLLGEMGLLDPSSQQKQMSGPLSGLVGVVPIVPVVTGTAAAYKQATQRLPSPALEEQTALLRQITRQNGVAAPTTDLLDELLGTPTAVPAARRRDWVQMVLGVLLLLAVVGGLLLPNLIPTSPPSYAPGLVRLENEVALLRNQTVLVSFDYTPATAGELDPAVALVLAQLAANNNRMVTMSQLPTGLATAGPLLAETGAPLAGTLGYIPGESLGLRQLAGCLNGQPCALPHVPAVAAVLVVAGDRDSLQDWVEQVAPQVAQPVLAVVPQAVAPSAQPYLTSGQLTGMVAGLPSAALLEQTTGQGTAAQSLLQSQALAQILVLLVLVAGAVSALLRRQ